MTDSVRGHLRQSDRFKGRDLGDEYLFYDDRGDQVHVLNGSARAIYLLCDGEKTRDEVAQAFARMYEVEEDLARRDALETIKRLVELELLKVS